MKFKIEQGTELVNSVGGISLVGKLLEKIDFRKEIIENFEGTRGQKRRTADVLTSWIGLLSQGRTDYNDIELFRGDDFFSTALNVSHIYSSSRFQEISEDIATSETENVLKGLNLAQLQNIEFGKIRLEEYGTEYIPCDVDVSPFDNSKSNKAGVSRTYKNFDGYAPMFAYIGTEGYMLNCELREGKQHCQNGTVEFLKETIKFLDKLGILDKVLFRLDSGNDATDNIRLLEKAGCKYVIKRNPRQENKINWLAIAKSVGEIEHYDDRKEKYLGSTSHIQPAGFTEKDIPSEIVFEVTERFTDRKGNYLLISDIELNTYWTNTGESPDNVRYLYHNHGTSEQFHSEIKSDMDLERFPSGTFEVNSMLLILTNSAFNCLRRIGMDALKFKEYAPVKMDVKRRRIRSVLRDLIYLGCKLVKHGGYQKLKFGRNCKWFACFRKIYFSYC